MEATSLYERLGQYEGIVAIVDEFLPRIQGDPQLGRFYKNRGADGIARERQLLIDFLCTNTGGPMYYHGRDMASAHSGMRITPSDWSALMGHCAGAMEAVNAAPKDCDEVGTFLASLKDVIVETQTTIS